MNLNEIHNTISIFPRSSRGLVPMRPLLNPKSEINPLKALSPKMASSNEESTFENSFKWWVLCREISYVFQDKKRHLDSNNKHIIIET